MKTKTIKLSDIVIDEDTQQRERIDLDMVAEYAESIQCGSKFPPVTVFFDSAQYWIADGYHRYYAHKSSDIHEILADVHDGTKDDAVMFSFGANGTHGKRLTNADKHNNVKRALLFHRTKELSDRDIAKVCQVTHPFVSKIRKEVVTITTNGNGNNLGNVSKTPPKPALNLKTEKHDNEDYDQKDTDSQEPEYTELDQIKDELSGTYETIRELTEEKNKLLDSLAAGQLPEDEIVTAEQTMIDLRDEIKSLKAQVVALTEARDKHLSQYNAEVKNSKYFQSLLKKAGLLNAKP